MEKISNIDKLQNNTIYINNITSEDMIKRIIVNVNFLIVNDLIDQYANQVTILTGII